MDISDVKLVVQWKATCDLCALWQRFGRAGRGAGEQATAILLVEKKDMNEERVLKAGRAARKKNSKREGIGTKRKAPTDLSGPQSKRQALADKSVVVVNQAVGAAHNTEIGEEDEQGDESDEDEVMMNDEERSDFLQERRVSYSKRDKPESARQPKGRARDLEPHSAMDDFINAQSAGFRCRREVPNLFFGNDKKGM